MLHIELRQHAHKIFTMGLAAVDPIQAIRNAVRRTGEMLLVGERTYHLTDYAHIYVLGVGKAGAAMAQAIETILDDRLTAGFVTVKYGHGAPTQTIRIHEAGHPVPDEASVWGTQQIIAMAETVTPQDLVFCLISGGGSALLAAPATGITLAEKQAVTRALLGCGATIQEINTIRKHLSAVKGGQLARMVAPATLITLILSDVIGDPLEMIASGPTVPDPQTFQDCWTVVEKYQLQDEFPATVRKRLQHGLTGTVPETPKAGAACFANTQNVIVASNSVVAAAAAQQAEASGYQPVILSTSVTGEARDVALMFAAILREIRHSGHPVKPPACVILGGETTVTLKGSGLGGRNQEFALAAASALAGEPDMLVLCAGTDGTDGPTDAAGAFADGETIARAHALGLQPLAHLQNNDSYHFFAPLNDLLTTGPTRTNVMDLYLGLVA